MHRNTDKFMLRMPDGWRAALKARAALNRRSLNQEILMALEGVVKAAGVEFGDRAPAAPAAHENHAGGHQHAAE